jgi:hypothetical protein
MSKECHMVKICSFHYATSLLTKLIVLQIIIMSPENLWSTVIGVAKNIGELRFAQALDGKVATNKLKQLLLKIVPYKKEKKSTI